MKSFLCAAAFVCCGLFSFSLSAQQIHSPSPTPTLAEITFEAPTFEYGMIEAGTRVVHTYHFTNTGNEPLVLSEAKGSCGCTVPAWPQEPILPGARGEVVVEFNSTGKKGRQNKRVTIVANTDPSQTFLKIQGDVYVEEEEEEAVSIAMPATGAAAKAAVASGMTYVVYPNPSTDVVQVKLKEVVGEQVRMAVYDELGRVMEERGAETVSLVPVTFDVSTYPAGTYRVVVQVDEKMMESKAFLVVRN